MIWSWFATLRTDGVSRLVLVVGGYAFKFGRGARGRRCNRFEANIWAEATEYRRTILCPVLACCLSGFVLVMPEARPLTKAEADEHESNDTYPDWDYVPGGPSEPFEYKASDWGYLDGRLVALDYAAPALDEACEA